METETETKGKDADRDVDVAVAVAVAIDVAQTCVSVYVGVSIFVVDVLLQPPSLRSFCLPSISYSVFRLPQSVFRIIIKFYFRHSIWEMSSVYDGFLTSLVIEYVRLFACSSVSLLLCSVSASSSPSSASFW